MAVKSFLDTNVLLYAFASGDPRQPRALALVEAGGVVSVQVLNEFAAVCRCKLRWPWADIRTALETLGVLLDPPAPLTLETHRAALDIAEQRKINVYDALIVAAAMASGAAQLLTEDLQDGQRFGDVLVQNPFT
jgi:predicted nucleic acid-binding protein